MNSNADEIWSLPWHALQRGLAEKFRAESAARAANIRAADTGVRNSSPPAHSWLIRALCLRDLRS